MTLTLPDEPALRELTAQDLRLELACALFARGRLGKVAGAELAGVDFFTFQEALGERCLSNDTVEDLHTEMEVLNARLPPSESPLIAS